MLFHPPPLQGFRSLLPFLNGVGNGFFLGFRREGSIGLAVEKEQGKKDENVEFVILNELNDFFPVSLSEVPITCKFNST